MIRIMGILYERIEWGIKIIVILIKIISVCLFKMNLVILNVIVIFGNNLRFWDIL